VDGFVFAFGRKESSAAFTLSVLRCRYDDNSKRFDFISRGGLTDIGQVFKSKTEVPASAFGKSFPFVTYKGSTYQQIGRNPHFFQAQALTHP